MLVRDALSPFQLDSGVCGAAKCDDGWYIGPDALLVGGVGCAYFGGYDAYPYGTLGGAIDPFDCAGVCV